MVAAASQGLPLVVHEAKLAVRMLDQLVQHSPGGFEAGNLILGHAVEDGGQLVVYDGQAGGVAGDQHVERIAIRRGALAAALPNALAHEGAPALIQQGVAKQAAKRLVRKVAKLLNDAFGQTDVLRIVLAVERMYGSVAHLPAHQADQLLLLRGALVRKVDPHRGILGQRPDAVLTILIPRYDLAETAG